MALTSDLFLVSFPHYYHCLLILLVVFLGQTLTAFKRQTITTAREKQSLNICPRETEPNYLPARKSIKFGARKSFMSAHKKQLCLLASTASSAREKIAKPKNRTNCLREKNPQLPSETPSPDILN
jgi:hypothetical protein